MLIVYDFYFEQFGRLKNPDGSKERWTATKG